MKAVDYYWNSINFVSIILLPLAGVFYLLSRLRILLYKLSILKTYKAPVPVIIIGNISVGGTGKTPLIIELVKQLQQQGKKPGVISRGYGGKAASWPQIVDAQTDAQQVGDEPQLIFQHTACPVVVGPDRKQDIELLLKKFDCDVLLSDDGLQHYALQRDIEIVVVDASRKFGNQFFIPAGPLRESQSRLKQVDMVIYNGGSNQQISFSMQPTDCKAVSGSDAEHKSLDSFSGETVHAVAGIGNPQRFFSLLEAHNIVVIPHIFKDHHIYQQHELNFADNLNVLMTEKDAVKCSLLHLPVHWSVPVNIVLNTSAQNKLKQLFALLK